MVVLPTYPLRHMYYGHSSLDTVPLNREGVVLRHMYYGHSSLDTVPLNREGVVLRHMACDGYPPNREEVDLGHSSYIILQVSLTDY